MRPWPLLSVLSVLSGLMLGGCATLPPTWYGNSIDWWAAAMEGGARTREAMWQDAVRQQQDWQLALLQSLPDSSRHDPAAARRGLRRTVAAYANSDIGALARLRLAELDAGKACEARVRTLERRLAEIIAIERRFDNDGR